MKGIAELTQNDLMLIAILGVLTLMVVLILLVGSHLINALNHLLIQEQLKKGLKPETLFQRLFKGWTDAVPMEKEETIMLDHDYDGIHELDNHLPPWWKWTFYISIIFGIVYLVDYHVIGYSPSQEEEFNIAMEQAAVSVAAYKEKMANSIDENNVTLLTEEADIKAGKEIFDASCATCHGKLGEGGIGPNLTDEFWLHGGSIGDVFKSVKYGIPEKGMKAWQQDLRPDDMQKISSYIMTLQGTNPPNAKEAQGEKHVPAK